VPTTACPYCGVTFAVRPGVAPAEATCPRCGKRPPAPGEVGPSPVLLTGLMLLGLSLLVPLGTGADLVGLVLGGALAAAGLALAVVPAVAVFRR
jgi:hypothetical protein